MKERLHKGNSSVLNESVKMPVLIRNEYMKEGKRVEDALLLWNVRFVPSCEELCMISALPTSLRSSQLLKSPRVNKPRTNLGIMH